MVAIFISVHSQETKCKLQFPGCSPSEDGTCPSLRRGALGADGLRSTRVVLLLFACLSISADSSKSL